MALDALLQPVVLFFLLGLLAAFVRSDLAVPEAVAKTIALYLMMSIGLRGGGEVADSGLTGAMLIAAGCGLLLSFLLPLPAFWLLQALGRLDRTNAAAVAAHYGSVSVVTFAAGSEVLRSIGMAPAGFMVAVLALMETPAILTGLLLAKGGRSDALAARGGLLHETFFNGSVVLLVGSFVIGMIAGEKGFAPIAPVFDDLFKGMLCLFLLDMGLVAARRLLDKRALTLRTVILAIALPIANGTVGVSLGILGGLDAGSAAALGILAGSASYIAVPAVMRLVLPEANPGLYLGMSLAVTFPFNLTLGIPYYAWVAQHLHKVVLP
ncbi:sodium-dependent bicarbonate transport family permease [Novosphingobium piscinae]|uniref:Sodium-dependent bicarbonate transport family permease n=1 Tax=Novosphingobium piscinae TaxID=1507448 RepID=A0A7X1KQ46_9SPHN|nr:sodium-dependent bicarbonate transport family permease [Novosphingobium piscinae]MBC2669148.1 sodium-dependent bicarbonate transport family permease [Novosphingobium piscinae]